MRAATSGAWRFACGSATGSCRLAFRAAREAAEGRQSGIQDSLRVKDRIAAARELRSAPAQAAGPWRPPPPQLAFTADDPPGPNSLRTRDSSFAGPPRLPPRRFPHREQARSSPGACPGPPTCCATARHPGNRRAIHLRPRVSANPKLLIASPVRPAPGRGLWLTAEPRKPFSCVPSP